MLATFLVVGLLSMTTQIDHWYRDSELANEDARNIDFLTQTFIEDVHSCVAVEPVQDGLMIVKDGASVTYSLVGRTLYRENESVISSVAEAQFIADDNVQITLHMQDGGKISIQARR